MRATLPPPTRPVFAFLFETRDLDVYGFQWLRFGTRMESLEMARSPRRSKFQGESKSSHVGRRAPTAGAASLPLPFFRRLRFYLARGTPLAPESRQPPSRVEEGRRGAIVRGAERRVEAGVAADVVHRQLHATRVAPHDLL